MEKPYKIKNLSHLLEDHIGPKATLSDYSTRSLIALGENYGSLILALEIKLDQNGAIKRETKIYRNGFDKDVERNGYDKEKTLCMVAKLCPPNEYLKEVFESAVTFKKEIACYKTIFPLLRSFQKAQGATFPFDFIPECYGARISLKPDPTAVDDDAVLLLENLKSKGYRVVDRMKGYDLQTARLILKDLAVFHALPLALKLLKPDLFEKNILPYLSRNTIFDGLSENAVRTITNLVIDNVKHNEKCKQLLPNIKKALRESLNAMRNPPPAPEPLATINHNDLWLNNAMLKFANNNPVANKIIDFQLIDYGSPANDVLFFLMSSVQMDVFDAHYDDLVRLYFDTFVETLKELKCETKLFTFERFLEEVDVCAKSKKFFHVVKMLMHILSAKGAKFKELSEVTEEDLATVSEVSEEYKKKIVHTILCFAKNNWI